MHEITLNPNQLNHLIDQLSTRSPFDYAQLAAGILSVAVLSWTLYLQNENAKIMRQENQISMMPYFDLFLENRRGVISYHLKVSHTTAYDVRITAINLDYFTKNRAKEILFDMLSPGVLFEYVPNFGNIANESLSTGRERIDIMTMEYTDFAGRNYLQTLSIIQGQSRVSKPVLFKR
jgi:hypothetical protein